MANIRFGTRASLLALTQTRAFVEKLETKFPQHSFEEVQIQTQGDMSAEPLQNSKTPGLFVTALRDALLSNEVDFIVHSMKDLPAIKFPGIVTACVPDREDTRDGLVSRENFTLAQLPTGAKLGTSSPRRTASIRKTRPDLQVETIRGNIDTRISKVEQGLYDATILAMAGLRRINRTDVVSQIFENDELVPAAGQGALSVECREVDEDLKTILMTLENNQDRLITTAERAVLLGLDAGCATAIGASGTYENGVLEVIAELSVEKTGESERVILADKVAAFDFAGANALGLAISELLKVSPIARKAAWK